jgi:hypothetical protein
MILNGPMSLATCSGQPGFPPCSNCARLRIQGIMRPTVKLSKCALFVESDRAKSARHSLGRAPTRPVKPRPGLHPYAGAGR